MAFRPFGHEAAVCWMTGNRRSVLNEECGCFAAQTLRDKTIWGELASSLSLQEPFVVRGRAAKQPTLR
jgi:hypothetical protein